MNPANQSWADRRRAANAARRKEIAAAHAAGESAGALCRRYRISSPRLHQIVQYELTGRNCGRLLPELSALPAQTLAAAVATLVAAGTPLTAVAVLRAARAGGHDRAQTV